MSEMKSPHVAEIYSFLYVLCWNLPEYMIKKRVDDLVFPVVVEISLLGESARRSAERMKFLEAALIVFREQEDAAFRSIVDGIG